MKYYVTGLLMLLATCAWGEDRWIPSYWDQSRFLSVSPTTGGVESALLNPASWALLRGPEALFQWSDVHPSAAQSRMWSLGIGVPHLGFGMQRWTALTEEDEETEATDYQIAIAGGDQASAWGLSYGWSKAGTDVWNRPRLLTAGNAWRPLRWLSVGASATFALGEKHWRTVADVGLRPLGDERLTLFAEGVIHDDQSFSDAGWAAGAMVEPLAGLRASCRLVHPGTRVHTDRYWHGNGEAGESSGQAGTTVQLGFGVSLGSVAGWIQPHYDHEDELAYTSYSVRAGYPQPSALVASLQKDKSYLKLILKGRLSYRPSRWFQKDAHHFLDILRQVREASEDPRVAGITLNISGLRGSWEMCWELRDELARARDAGKKVVIFMDDGGMKEYYLASIADYLVLDPEGMLLLPGLRFGRTYYRDALKKLGLGFREFRYFRYKSAAEAFSRRDMSEGEKEQLQALVDDWYTEIRDGVCASRSMTPARYDSLIDGVAAFTAKKALTYGLVDTLARWGEASDVVKTVAGKKNLVAASSLRQRRPVRDRWGKDPQIAVIYALGPCAMDEGIAARRLVRTIRKARKSKDVVAVVLRADSPGGAIIPSDMVAEELAKTAEKKPVLVSQGQVAGSGGYWISMNGDRIVTSPFTVTGSIGVIGGWLWNKGIGAKLGLNADLVQAGRHADLGFGVRLPLLGVQIPDRDVTKRERRKAKALIKGAYQGFIEKVADARGMTPEAVDSVGQGRIWTGRAAVDNGLVDEIGGLLTTVDLAKEAAGIDPDQPVTIREMPPRPLLTFDFGPARPISTDCEPWMQYLRVVAGNQPYPIAMMPPDVVPPNE